MVYLKQIKWLLEVGNHPLVFCKFFSIEAKNDPGSCFSSLREWYFSAENFVFSLMNFKKRSSYFSLLIESWSKLFFGTSTLRNFIWWLNIKSILLLRVPLSMATTELELSNFRIIKFLSFVRFLKTTNSFSFNCCRIF